MKPRLWLFVPLLALVAAGQVRCAKLVRGPYLQNASVGAVEVRWELDRKGRSSIEYRTGAETPVRVESPFEGRKHRARLTGLRAGAPYHYRIRYRDERVGGESTFRTTPVGADPYTFAVFGDSGAGTKGQFQVARLLERSAAEFVLLTGDIIYSRGEEEHWETRFFEPYRNSLRRMTFWPALGNHDVGVKDGAAALAVFDVPLNGPAGLQGGRNYSFDYGNAHVAAFDSNAAPAVLRDVIGPWLERDMKASRQTWKFVFMHHPPFSSAAHGETAKIRDVMTPFFSRARVDVVFSGHDHAYERVKPRGGVLYVVSGNGGARLYAHKNPHAYTDRFYNEKHGLTLVSVQGRRLTLRHVNVDGKEIDRCEVVKGGL